MTFEEARELLRQIRGLKTKARDIVKDINECRDNIEALTLRSALSGAERVSGGEMTSVEERIIAWIEQRQAQLEETLGKVMSLEDRLAEAIRGLTETEQDVIINYYLRDKSHARLAREMNYSERSIKYIKARAIGKISDKM